MTILLVIVIVCLCLTAGINNFRRGDLSPAFWAAQTPAQQPSQILGIKESTVDVFVVLIDVTNTNHGGHTARIRGRDDHGGTISASVDADLMPWTVLVAGQSGILVVNFGQISGIQLPGICEKVHFQGASMDKECLYSFDEKQNSLAGLLVYPALI